MNYFPFHVGDYAAHTAHLEPMEDLAYRRMLDLYYLRESALPAESAQVARLIRMRSNVADVEAVLNEFFVLGDDGWRQERCDQEIAHMQDKQAKAKASAEASVNARKANVKAKQETVSTDVKRTLNGRSTNAELPTPTPTPIEITPIPPLGAESENIPAKQKAAVAFPTWLESIKVTGEKPIPETDPVFSYATQVGIPPEHLRLCWREFRDRYSQPGAKRYRDWRGVFRKAVRGNWLKLWWIDGDGAYSLTTTGKQAEKAAS